MSPAKREMVPRHVALAVKILVTLAALWLVSRRVDVREMGDVLARANWWWFALCVGLQVLVAVLNAVRWKLLMDVKGLSLGKYLYYVFVGYFLSVLLPSAAFAEVARTYAFGKRYGMVQKNLVAMVVLRGTGLASAVLLAAVLIIHARQDISRAAFWGELRVDSAFAFGFFAALVGAAIAARIFFWPRVASIVRDVRGFLRDRRTFGKVFLVSLVIQIVMAFSVQSLFRSIHWELAFWQAASIPVVLQVLLLLPISLGGVGVREYLSVVLYQQFGGVPDSAVLAATILSYVPLFVVAMTGAAWMTYRRRLAPSSARRKDQKREG